MKLTTEQHDAAKVLLSAILNTNSRIVSTEITTRGMSLVMSMTPPEVVYKSLVVPTTKITEEQLKRLRFLAACIFEVVPIAWSVYFDLAPHSLPSNVQLLVLTRERVLGDDLEW